MSDTIIVKNVRISFPSLFTKPVINGQEGKFGAKFILDPESNKAAIRDLESRIAVLVRDKLKNIKLPSEKKCLRSGDDMARPEYEVSMVLSASNKVRPVVIDKRGQPLSEEDGLIYSGCRVNAKVDLWAQDNKFGKRINATLIAVQFQADDEPLGGGHVTHDQAVEGFDFDETEDF